MKKIIIALFLLPLVSFAQEDLLSGLDSTSTKNTVESAFKALKIVNLESTKIAAKGDFYFIVAHRFASIKSGFEGGFGLDNANTQLKFIKGITNWMSVSAARSELAYDFAVKYRLQNQIENGFPVAIVGFSSIAFNNTLKESNYPKMRFEDRIIYVQQILVSRKFSEKLSLQLAPTVFHENFTVVDSQENTQFAIGAGGRYKLTKRLSVNVDYAAHLNRSSNSPFKNPLSVGVDIESGGHVFQMHFTSSQGIHEAGYLGNSTGSWNNGDVYFGFNLSRVF
jgi:hypothetical protein